MLNSKPMKPSVGGKWRQQILLTPRARGDRHATALIGGNRAGSDQLKEFGIRVVHHRSEPYRSIVIERGQRDNQTAAGPQLGRPQGQECFPVSCRLAIELGPDRAGRAGNEEVVRDLRRNLAEPDGSV
jgi:hypothetical protein